MIKNKVNPVISSYIFWQAHKFALVAIMLIVLTVAGGYCSTLNYSNDIKSMLPDSKGSLADDFELFSYAPFARNVLISLESDQAGPDRLIAVADEISGKLKTPFFTRVVSGITQDEKIKIFNWFFNRIPCLFEPGDIEALSAKVLPESVDREMQANLRLLHQPESVMMKDIILQDPLALREILPGKFRQINFISAMKADSDYFIKDDGRQLLVIVDTPVSITDFGGSSKMLESLSESLKKCVPADLKYRVVCGHRYTVANAQTIKNDLKVVLAVSVVGLLAVFLLLIFHWSALVIFSIPLVAMLVGLTVTGLTFEQVSAITVGFGGVLLGISADYGLHIFYAMQKSGKTVPQILAEITRPMLFCSLTTISVFSVLLFSVMPVQRQLAVFSISGILTALFLVLFVIPHLLPSKPVLKLKELSAPRFGRPILYFWILLLSLAIIPALSVRFDGNIRSIGMMPEHILADEQAIKSSWGSVREQAMVFLIGEDMQAALETNDAFFRYFTTAMPGTELLSIARIMPSAKSQEENIARWHNFWQEVKIGDILKESGVKAGFTASAFDTFVNSLSGEANPYTPQDLYNDGGDKMIAPFMVNFKDGSCAVLCLIPDQDEALACADSFGPEVKVLSNRQFSQELGTTTSHDFIGFFSVSIVLIFIEMSILFRNFKKLILAFLPVLVGILIMAGVMGSLGIKINLFNMVASVLVIGLTIDYGLFVVCSHISGTDKESGNAVLVSGITTFIGFGSLILAKHPSMYSIGITVVAGIVPGLLFALTLLPYIAGKWLKKVEENA